MNWNLFLQFIGYAFLVSVYAVFAWAGKAPVEGFIAVLVGAITALGSSHMSARAAKAASDAAANAIASAMPSAPPTTPTEVIKS